MAEIFRTSLHTLLWSVPALPLAAGLLLALLPNRMGQLAAKIAIAAQAGSCLLTLAVLTCVLPSQNPLGSPLHTKLTWLHTSDIKLEIGVLLDPISAAMITMIAFVALWIFIYSFGYMRHEARFGRFFGFLALFTGAMLLLVLSNSLLLLFMAWELVGLASYLLIGFYYDKPAAAAAAQKAFITTRFGDMAFFLGLLWLSNQAGTLLFYDHGNGLLESGALANIAGVGALGGLAVSSIASLLLLVGAMGKSGQFPLHTWLPDAMEGPTPVSALIHAATMVAAGIFLVARMYPVFCADTDVSGLSVSLSCAAWIGGITALFGALAAMAQSDIKRILAYSTISQLGLMLLALGTGGVAAALFHLIVHAFFKALLFLSAGSVIHGCAGEQDIRRMGGLAKSMPRTFAVYAIGMMALAGFPFLFAGFWSKEAILHSAEFWPGGHGPFVLAALSCLLTAVYMTRQMLRVFFGNARDPIASHAHESPSIMLVPMQVLATGTVLLAIIGTPAWPWFAAWIDGKSVVWSPAALTESNSLKLIGLSLGLFSVGSGVAFALYRRSDNNPLAPDPIEAKIGFVWSLLQSGMGIDALYKQTIISTSARAARLANQLDQWVFIPMLSGMEILGKCLARVAMACDQKTLNQGFHLICRALCGTAEDLSRRQSGRPQAPLRAIGLGLSALILFYLWLVA